jgi:hypothetical protein
MQKNVYIILLQDAQLLHHLNMLIDTVSGWLRPLDDMETWGYRLLTGTVDM